MACQTNLEQLANSSTESVAIYQASEQSAIQELQSTLYILGFGQDLHWGKYGADGVYGPATTQALAQFARQQYLPSDGKKLTQDLAQRILDTLAPFYGPQWATTNILDCQAHTDKLVMAFTATNFIGKR